MLRADLNDLNTFLMVAEERSFTRAARRLHTSQSAVSTTVRRMEERLGVRLLTRTTRKVMPTEAGQRLLDAVGPAFRVVGDELAALASLRDAPAGIVRISTSDHAAQTLVWPAAARLMAAYPDIRVEISVDAALTDIVAHRFDAGVRLGEHIAQDMVAVRIGPDVSMAAVASPAYLEARLAPTIPDALGGHECINIRTPTHGDLYTWEFERNGREVRVRVEGRFTCNHAGLAVRAAEAGLGIAFVPHFHAADALAAGSVVRVLEEWCPPFDGYHLYYPSRRHNGRAFELLVDALRHRP